MRKNKIMGIFGLVLSVAAFSQAGFRDALKAAAGTALNEVVGTPVATGDVPANNASVTNQSQNAAGANGILESSITQSAPAGASSTQNSKAVEISDESITPEEFRAKKDLSEDEYAEWLTAVVNAVRDTAGDFSKINSEKEFSVGDVRVNLPADETVIRVNSADGVVFTDKAAYYLYYTPNKGCIRNNYEKLALSGSYNHLKESGKIAQEKLHEFLDKREQLAASMQKQKEEDGRKDRLQKLQASRSGKIAYSGKIGDQEITLQWGDSGDVLSEICGFGGAFAGDTSFLKYEKQVVEGEDARTIQLFADPDAGLFQIIVSFSEAYAGGQSTVTPEILKEKYVGKYGQPENVIDPETKQVVAYRWISGDDVVEVAAVALPPPYRAMVVLKNSPVISRTEEAVRKREIVAQEKQKAKAGKMLDF